VRGIPGEEQPTVLHGLDDQATHGGDTLVEDRPLGESLTIHYESLVQLFPDPVVRPALQYCHIEAAELEGAYTVEREAALVVGVGHLFGRRRNVGKDANQAKGYAF
jgi:hypothetical protein